MKLTKWKRLNLMEICRPTQWKTISISSLTAKGYPVYGANGVIGNYSEFNHKEPTLMITCRGATCGTLNISQPFSYITGNAMALDDLDLEQVDLKFLYYLLNKRGFSDVISGSAQPQITRQGLEKIIVALPPLPEQQRIVAILDKADAIRRKRQEAIRLVDELLRSVFLDMFGDPVTNPKGWPIYKLAEMLEIHAHIGTPVPAKDEGNQVCVRVGEIGQKNIDLQKCKFVSLQGKELERFLLKDGDIVFARAIGSESHLGKASIFFQNNGFPVVFDSHVMRLRFNDSKLSPIFFYQWLNSDGGRSRFMKQARRTAVQFNINSEQISSVEIPLPNRSLQEKFVNLYYKFESLENKLKESFEESENFFQALVQRAFRGEL